MATPDNDSHPEHAAQDDTPSVVATPDNDSHPEHAAQDDTPSVVAQPATNATTGGTTRRRNRM